MSNPLIYQEETDYLPRSEQIWIKSNDIIGKLCHFSKNLWNEGNYIIRQEYEEADHILKSSENYLKLPTQSAQQTLRILYGEWKGYSVTKEDYKIHLEKYLGKPKMPGYLDKDGEFVLYFTDGQIKNIDGEISFPKTRIRYKFQLGLNLDFLKIKTRINKKKQQYAVRRSITYEDDC